MATGWKIFHILKYKRRYVIRILSTIYFILYINGGTRISQVVDPKRRELHLSFIINNTSTNVYHKEIPHIMKRNAVSTTTRFAKFPNFCFKAWNLSIIRICSFRLLCACSSRHLHQFLLHAVIDPMLHRYRYWATRNQY